MNSKKSIYFKSNEDNGYVHLFKQYVNENEVFQFEKEELEKISKSTIKLNLEDMIIIGNVVDFDNLKKQAFLSDEEIEGFCLSLSQKNSTYFENIFEKYKQKRNELARIVGQVQKSKAYPVELGLEEVISWKQQSR